MPGIAEEFISTVETALVLVPGLLDVPILGRILIALGFGHGNDNKALEQLEKLARDKQTERATRRDRNNRYLIKASDAMKCVEDNLMGGNILLAFGKGLVNAIIGRTGAFAPDLLVDQIWTCIEQNVLRQDTPRVKGQAKSKYIRPAVGHGHGRDRF